MNAKERFYSGMARETIGKITANKDNWTAFLTTMARNYDFTYPEQVMIYAQRPNATFCKPYEEWNDEKFRRYVKRGSTGILGLTELLLRQSQYVRRGIRQCSTPPKSHSFSNHSKPFYLPLTHIVLALRVHISLLCRVFDLFVF